jgi:endogenous inhibitor of DNA gyrase (YacG/DUF329 family)
MQEEYMKCPNCGKEVAEGKKFCGFCGANLQKAPPAAPPAIAKSEVAPERLTKDPDASTQMTKKRGWVLPLIIVMAAVFVLAVFMVMRQKKVPLPQPPSAVQESAPSSSSETTAIAGSWVGNNSADFPFCKQLNLKIQNQCIEGDICGTFSVSNTGTYGNLKLIGLVDGTYEMLEILLGSSDFKGTGYEYLTLKGNELDYRFEGVFPSGEKTISLCTLTKQ